MDLRQLRYFTAIAEEKQITRAAKKLHMAQPPLSHQLKLLEQELGVLLLERNGKEMELTEAGKTLYKRGKDLIEKLEEINVEVQETGEGLRGILAFGTVKTCFSYLSERIRLFREQYPLVTYRVLEGDSYELTKYLQERKIEFAVVRLPVDMENFSFLPLPTENFVAIVPEDLEVHSSISLKEIAKMPLMLLHRIDGTGLYELVIEAFMKNNLKPNIVCECADAAILLSLVKSGSGITLLPESTLSSFPLNGLKIIKVNDCVIESKAAVIWLKDRYISKSAKRLIETFNV
ncbi:LysR family transcriptional regulator [Priestia endophytica]|jgi:DNA-binding transcriptional LysR family regulator|uniref:LysR family transcriptional regulator n=1 Tax=Priestia filamentosa TaxID=1402861 RepID=UPI002E1D6D0E|nr:LysR family transcriptional regulator [Priestia filamentosa]